MENNCSLTSKIRVLDLSVTNASTHIYTPEYADALARQLQPNSELLLLDFIQILKKTPDPLRSRLIGMFIFVTRFSFGKSFETHVIKRYK